MRFKIVPSSCVALTGRMDVAFHLSHDCTTTAAEPPAACLTCGGCSHERRRPFHRCKEWTPLPLYAPARIASHERRGHVVVHAPQPEKEPTR